MSPVLSGPPQPELAKLVPLIVVIGLQKPYAKMKVGESCTCKMFLDS
jgi:hypothetical protein